MRITIEKQQALLKLAELLNSTQDTNYILDALLKESLNYIKGGDAGIIFLFNEETGFLEVKSQVGFDKECANVKLKPNQSMTGITFQNRKPMFFKNPDEIKKATNTMGKENQELINHTFKNIFPRILSCICCPLIFGDKCMGVIVVDNFTKENTLTDDDLDFLKAISINAAVAVNNAINYEKEIQNNISLQNYTKIIEKQRNQYQFSTNLHNKLTSMVLEGCSVQDIISELAKILDKDIIIIDLFYNIKNYVLERSLPFNLIKKNRAKIAQSLNKYGNSVFNFSESNHSLYINPIIVSKETLGWMGIISKEPITSEMDKITIERGATILAIELLKLDEMLEMEQKLKGDFLDNLILNQDENYILKYANHYGYNLNREHQIMIIEINNNSIKEDMNIYNKEFMNYQKRLLDSLAQPILKHFPNTISIIKGHNIIFILELNKITKANLSKSTIKKILTSFLALAKNNIFAGLSNTFTTINEFKDAYYNARQSLKIGKKISENDFIFFYEDLEVKKLLLNNTEEDLQQFVQKILGNLLNYTNNSQKEFLTTLSTYVKSNGNWSFTKEKLLIHGNTLNYRLKRIEEILDMDLNNYAQRLKIQIALEILDIITK